MSQNNGWQQYNNDKSSQDSGRKVQDPEILGPDNSHSSYKQYGDSQNQGRQVFRVFTYTPVNSNGCLPFFVTFALFFILIAQFGLLAGIGFCFFYIIGSIMGSIYSTRQLMRGYVVNPWTWRTGNWVVSFLLTVFFAGGFS